MKKKEIYIPIELKPREFISQVYLAGELAKIGGRVFIGSKVIINDLIKEKKNNQGVFFYKGGGGSYKKFKKISTKVKAIAVLDQELSPVMIEDDHNKFRFTEGSVKYVSRHYYISKEMKEKAIKYIKDIDPNTTRDVGWPRVDLWQTSKHYISNESVKKIHNKYGNDFILFSSDFAHNSKQLLDERNLRLELLGAKKTKDELESFRQLQKRKYEYFLKFIDYLHQVENDNNISQIIIRPHPAEDHEVWKNKLNNFKKIKLAYDGEITPWLLASKGLLHRGCTTAIQAFISGIKIGFLSNFADENNKSIVSQVSTKLNTHEEFSKWTNSNLIEPSFETNKNILKKHINFPINGATKDIAKDMMTLTGNPVIQSTITEKFILNKIITKLFFILKSKKSKKNQPDKLGNLGEYNKMLDGITSNEVNNYLLKMYPDEKIQVTQLKKDLCCIEKLV